MASCILPNSASVELGELGKVEDFDRNLRRLKLWAKFSTVLIALYVICATTFAVTGFAILGSATSPDQSILEIYGLSAVANALVFYFSAFAVGMWIYRAHDNLTQFGLTGLEFTPGWSVGWFFVPFANLVKPYEAMRELWSRSLSNRLHAAALLPLWWGCFLVGGIAMTIGGLANRESGDLKLILALTGTGSILRATSAVLLAIIIGKVSTEQASMEGIGTAFD